MMVSDGSSTGPRPPGYATYAEAADYSRISERTLRRAIAAGRLPAHRVGSRVVIAYRDLDTFIAGGPQDGPGRPAAATATD